MAERKDAPSSFLTGRKTSTAIQASTNHLNTQKSPRSEKQMGPTPSTVNIPPLNVKSTEKSADISEKSAEDVEEQKEGGSRASYKRKRYNAIEFKARYKSQRVRAETEGSVVPAHTESDAVGDGTPVANETADGNAESLYQHLKPTLSELCNILKFSEDAKIIVERFLKFVVGDFNVSKEHTSTLQALMISACWICSSLSKYTIDRKESFTLATEHLNFSCKEEEVDQVYEKLKKPKEMFLQNPMNLEVLNAFKDRASRPEEPRKSPAVPLNPQEQKRENHGVSNEEALQSSRQILVEDIARKERNEIDKFDREWNEKKMSIVNEFELEKTLIRYLYKRNLSVRSEKLNLVDKNFADELNKHEKSRQVVVNDEISLNRPANETQILDLVESEKENQERREVAHDLLGNPTEAESRKTSNDMVSGSHTSEKHMANATVLSEPNAVNDVTPNVDSADGSHAIQDPPNETGLCDMAPNDYSADMSHAVEDPNKIGSNDASLHADSDQMGIPAANDLTPHIEYVDGSHAVKDPNGTGPNHVAPNVESAESAGNCNQDKAPYDYSADMSHAVEDPNKNGSNDTSLHADSDQMGIPAANDLTQHIEYAEGSHAVEDPTRTGPNHGAPNVESPELGIPAGNCNPEKAHDTTPSVQQVASPVSDHSMPAITEIHNDSNLLQQPSENGIQHQEGQADPTPAVDIEDDNLQPVEAIQVDQIIPEDSSLNPHDEPPSAISTHPTITENQAAMPSTSVVLVQTTAPPITAQAQMQLGQYLFDLQRNANFNQAASPRTGGVDPLHIELLRLSSVKEKMVKSHHDNIQKMNIDCEKEIAEAIAEIRLKYSNKRQEADVTINSQKKEVENNMNTVAMNQLLAACFRRKCQVVSGGFAAVQQARQAESMQQQRRFHGTSTYLPGQSSGTQQTPPRQAESMQQQRRFHGTSTYLPGQSSGTQQTPPRIPATAVATPPQRTQPPLQIVHQFSDFFSTPLNIHPHTSNLRPANTTSIRPPLNTNPIPTIPATTTTCRRPRRRPATIAPLIIPSTTTNRPPPAINTTSIRPANTTSIRPPLNTNPIPIIPATNTTCRRPRRRPATIAPLIIPSTTTNRSPPAINPITPSTPTITPITPSTTPSPIRSPHGVNPLTSSTTPIRTPSRLNPFGMSSPPLVSSVPRSTPPHMRPFVRREFWTPGPHVRPFNPTSSSGLTRSGTYDRTLPVHHVTSSLPLTSPSNSQPLNSPSMQTPPPRPREPRSQSPHASAVRSPSVPQSGGPQG